MNSRPSSPAPMPEERLRQLASRLTPKAGAEDRVRRMIRARSSLRSEELLGQVRDSITPAPGLATVLWSRILSSMDPIAHLSLWERFRGAVNPADDVRDLLWSRFSLRLKPSYAHAITSRPVKWVAAFAVLLVAVRVSPILFLAPATIAGSSVTLFSQEEGTEVLIGSLWQPLRGEITLNAPARLQTQKGQATIADHDDAVFRLAPGSRVHLLDLSDRPEASTQETTIALEEGEVWVLGLVPKHVRAITVLTSQGRILLHEGSASIRQTKEGTVVVRVLDRSATISRHGQQLHLVAGEQTVLTKDGDLVATAMARGVFQDAWVAGNLTRDAAHQHEIAQLQQERRAASAGILPGTTLYPVKRLAESVDVLFALNDDDRARKLITQANTRLNEAAALLGTEDDAEAQNALQQYKDTMLQVASGSGGSPLVHSLLQKELVDAGSSTVSAALPGDSAYALKQAVDDTIASLPDSVTKPDVEGETLLDELSAVKRQVAQGETANVREKLSEITVSIATMNASGSLTAMSPDIRHEVAASAGQVAAAVNGEVSAEITALTLGAPAKEPVTPEHPARVIMLRPLTPEQITAKAQEIRGRIFFYGSKKAQYDALEDQLSLISRSTERGRILRELSKVLPRNGLAQRVVREIRTLQGEVEEQVTASGGITPQKGQE